MSLDRFINGLNIPNIGRTASKLISTKIGEGFLDVSYDDIVSIDGIGDVLAESYVDFIQTNKEDILELFTIISPVVSKRSGDKYLNKNICITGTFDKPRHTLKDLLENLGARVVSSVSKNTDYVLVGDNAGSKKDKAIKLNIPILKEKEIMNE